MGKIINTNSLQLQKFQNWSSKAYQQFFVRETILIDNVIHTYYKLILESMRIAVGKIILKRTNKQMTVHINYFKSNSKEISTEQIQKCTKSIGYLTNTPIEVFLKSTNQLDAQMLVSIIKNDLKRSKTISNIMSALEKEIKKDSSIKGIRIECAGRPKKMDMARTDVYKSGKIPLHTHLKRIDYAHGEVVLRYGKCGIKVWINKN